MPHNTDIRGPVVWFTGYSGSGKTTLCQAVTDGLLSNGLSAQMLDGDDLRRGVCADLGYEISDRVKHVRRVAHLADLLSKQGNIVLVAVICPLESLRQIVRSVVPNLIQVYVDAPLAICEQRDPKGLYKKARAGVICDFTGIDATFEPPACPDVVCHTDRESVEESAEKVLNWLYMNGLRGRRTVIPP